MATDAEIRARGIKYLPPQKYLQNPYEFPVEETPPVSGGITNTNAFTGGSNDFNPAGNAFGYGSPVSEVNVRTFNPQSNDPTGSVASAQEAYNQFGDINDKSIYSNYADINNPIMDNRQNYQANYNSPYDDTVDLGYMGRDTSTSLEGRIGKDGIRRRSGLGKAIDFVTGFIPGVGAVKKGAKFIGGLLPDNPSGPGGGTYGIGGLSDAQKEQYNALAGIEGGGLFQGQGGMKTLTGKNFTGKGYLEGQIDIYNKEFTKTDGTMMTEEEITDLIAKTKTNPRQQFKYKQMLEASQMYKTNKEQQDKINERNASEAAAAAAGGNRSAQAIQKARDDNTVAQAYAGNDGYSDGSSGQQSDGSYNDPFEPGGGEKDGGFIDGSNRRPFNNGGRVSFKNGGLASIL